MIDPRLAIISKRFDNIGKIIAVSSGKGGVGKSMVASNLALNLRDQCNNVGLLDLDFTSPCTHVILGIKGLYPDEEYGIIPPKAHDIMYMSITHYSLDKPVPFRGIDISNAIIELLAITRWGELDYLVIDMPPGIGDATLDAIRLIPRIQFLVISTPSKVAYQSVKRLLVLFKDLKVPVIGVVENMVMKPSDYVKEQVESIDIRYIGNIKWDESLEDAIGDPELLVKTGFCKRVGEFIPKLG